MDPNFINFLKEVSLKINNLYSHNQEFYRNKSFTLQINEDGTGNALSKIPSEKDIKSFLIDFRPFVLQKEAVHIPTLCNRVILEIKDMSEYSDLLKKISDFIKNWNNFCNNTNIGGIAVKYNNEKMKVKEIIDLWLNGKYFHPTDIKKKKYKKLKDIDVPPFGPMHYFFFLEAISRLAECIFWFNSNIIDHILETNDKN